MPDEQKRQESLLLKPLDEVAGNVTSSAAGNSNAEPQDDLLGGAASGMVNAGMGHSIMEEDAKEEMTPS